MVEPFCFAVSSLYLTLRVQMFNDVINRDDRVTDCDKEHLQLLRHHNEVCNLVEKYDKRWRILVYQAYFILMPIMAFNFLTVFFIDMSIVVTWMMIILLIDHAMIGGLVLGMASKLHSDAFASYTRMCSIICKERLSIKSKLKMRNVVSRIAAQKTGYVLFRVHPICKARVGSVIKCELITQSLITLLQFAINSFLLFLMFYELLYLKVD